MYSLPGISSFHPFSPFTKKSLPKKFDLLAQSFDDSLLRRVESLSPPSLSLSWLSQAVDFLAFVYSQANALISSLDLSSLDESLAEYLDNCLIVLHLCNSALLEIEGLRQHCLRINFLLQLLPSDLDRLRDSIILSAENGFSSTFLAKRRGYEGNVKDLIRDLAAGLNSSPCEKKVSTVGRLVRQTAFAVELVTVFVAEVAVSILHGSWDRIGVHVPAEFAWADSFNKLEAAISAELKRRVGVERGGGSFKEMNGVESRIREVRDAIGGKAERLDGAVKELEKVTESFSEELDRLGSGVNRLFQVVLCSRNGMFEGSRRIIRNS